jgi:hypothetical protein
MNPCGALTAQLAGEISFATAKVKNPFPLHRKAPVEEKGPRSPIGKELRFIPSPMIGAIVKNLLGTVMIQFGPHLTVRLPAHFHKSDLKFQE